MRTKSAGLVSVLLVLGLLLPSAGWARRETVVGSLAITKAGGVALTTELTGVVVFTTPSWERLIPQQIPPFTFPVVLDAEQHDDDDALSPSHRRRAPVYTDTVLVLTNTTGSPLALELTVREGDGSVLLDKAAFTLGANATSVVVLSQLLP